MNPTIFYKFLYPILITLQAPLLYLILRTLCKNERILKLSMIFSLLVPYTLYVSSIRFGFSLIVYLVIMILTIRIFIEKHMISSNLLALTLMTISLPLCYYTVGMTLLMLLSSLYLVFLAIQKDRVLRNTVLLITFITSASFFLYAFYISIILRMHIFNTVYSMMRYPEILGERAGYAITVYGLPYHVKRFVTLFPYALATLGVGLSLSSIIYKWLTKRLIGFISYNEYGEIIFVWLLICLLVNVVLAFTRTGFVFFFITFNPLFTLGVYTVYSLLSTPLLKKRMREILLTTLVMVLLITQFLGSTYIIDSILKLDTSSPLLDRRSMYRGDDSTEIYDYYMLRYLLTSLPHNNLDELYSDTKISNSIISVASDLYLSNQLQYKPIEVIINPYALPIILKNSGKVKGILILSTYNLLTGKAIVPQGTIEIDFNTIYYNDYLVYNSLFSHILIRGD
ncbi:MAG: hypothetical protein QXY40_06155 [Candidatus Methanomethylicia archaeon]